MSVKTYIFPNGLKLIYEKSPGNIPVTQIQAFCNFGSVDEPEDSKGAAHFIEHMCFKGTTTIANSSKLTQTYDKIGAYMNATTNKLYTCYVIKCDSNFVENMVELVSDMMLNSTLSEKECEKEIQVVIEESSRNSDDSKYAMFIELDKMVYKDSIYDLPVDTIEFHKKNFVYSKIRELYKQYYQPNRIVLSVVSDLTFDHVKRIVASSIFNKTKNSLPCKPILNQYIPPQSETLYKVIEKKSESTTHLAIGFRVYKGDRHKLVILKTILGGPMSARLFTTLREQNGLTYTSTVTLTLYDDYGDLTLYAESESAKIMKNGRGKKGVFPLIIGIINDVIKNGVTDSEVDLTKQYLKGSLNTNLDSNESKCKHNGLAALLSPNEPICPYNKLYDVYYKDISKTEINEIARKYLTKSNMSVCFSGGTPPKLSDVKPMCERLGE
jgi:predicted Zn-dependent peptidase